MNINHANKTTTDLKLYHANDFFDVNKKSAQIQGIINSLKMALKIKPDELDLYVEDTSEELNYESKYNITKNF